MILVDSSVWIDYFNGSATLETAKLDWLLTEEPVAVGDLILAEVLQGFRRDGDFERAKATMLDLPIVELGGVDVALRAARNFRKLRAKGVTVRKTIDSVIAARCIESRLTLLHSDRDFDPFVEHLGLRVVDCA